MCPTATIYSFIKRVLLEEAQMAEQCIFYGALNPEAKSATVLHNFVGQRINNLRKVMTDHRHDLICKNRTRLVFASGF
jgi:hypothetical protein